MKVRAQGQSVVSIKERFKMETVPVAVIVGQDDLVFSQRSAPLGTTIAGYNSE